MQITKPVAVLCSLVALLGVKGAFADVKVGDVIHGFKLVEKRFVKEVNADVLNFEHEKSGARLVKIAAGDANKLFSIAFKTVPQSDCGTPHIMEHSVLNGSKNFPVKSPFDVLAQGSLNTFLNAMTGSDVTVYPVASMNDKDYFNLMHVYLDAVFNPLIYDDPQILMQEGWHRELTSPDGEIVYKGVVYNEMKGSFSSPTRELGYQIEKRLFPDNGYGFSSGGYPPAIPSLTYEDFLNFHRRFYHPDNSYILLYGNGNLDKELAFIDGEYLSQYTKSDKPVAIPLQKPFEAMKEATAYYPVGEEASTEDQSYLTLTWVAGLDTNRALVMALDVLTDVLVNQESAPVRLALQEAGVGRDVNATIDDVKQNMVQIIVQNANPEDKDKFRDIIMKTLKETVSNGLDKEALEGTLNRMEFRLREGDDAQKGLTYNMRMLYGWFFANNPYLGLEFEKPLAEVKQSLTSDYLEKIIQTYLIDNPHALLLVLEPKPGLESENNEKIKQELAEYKASLSQEELEKLVKETDDLLANQKREDTPEALATIPMLDLQDINPEAEWYSVTESQIKQVPVLHHNTFTNDVVYVNLYFDLKTLPQAMIPYAALLAEVMGSMNTENYTYGELDNALNIHTGGFSTRLSSYLENMDDSQLLPKFTVSVKAMKDKTDKLFGLTEEILLNSKYNDPERLKAVLTRHQSRLDANVKQNGYGYARSRALSYFSNERYFSELTGGAEYYWFVTDLVNNFDEQKDEIVSKLVETASLLINKNQLIAAVTCDSNDLSVFNEGFKEFVKSLPASSVSLQQWAFQLEKKNEGMQTPSKVQYVIQGYDFKKLGYAWDGKMRVLDQILSSDFLQNRVRVIGGAYGGFSYFSPDGIVYFASYRDPNLAETLKNYSDAPAFMESFEADDATMTRFIIGTIAGMDRPLTPSQQGNKAIQWYFEKMTKAQVQADRDAVLATKPEDIQKMAPMVKEILDQKAYCVYGNEEKVETEKALFETIFELSR